MIIDFLKEKYDFFENKQLGINAFAKLNSLMESLFKKIFYFFKKNEIDMDEFRNLNGALKNPNILKIFFHSLFIEFKGDTNESNNDYLTDQFNIYFGALFDVFIYFKSFIVP